MPLFFFACVLLAERSSFRPLYCTPIQVDVPDIHRLKDRDANVIFPNSVYGNNESRCRSYQQLSIYSLEVFRGVVVRFRTAETHRSAAVPQHATDHGDRGARGSSDSCSANGPGGCRIFASLCCSVRVCAGANLRPNPRGNIWRRNTLPPSQPEIGTKHPLSMDFLILEIVRTNIRLHMKCTQILLQANLE